MFVIYVTITYTPIDRAGSSRRSRCSCRCGYVPRNGARRSAFTTDDGLSTRGKLPRGPADPTQAGVLVFCHEYLSDRWSYQPYVDHLRDLGFDVFTFDFRNHGASDSDPATARSSG